MNELPRIGIEQIGFYTTNKAFSLLELAQHTSRNNLGKYTIGLGQKYMSVITPDEDIMSMATKATQRFITDEDRRQIVAIFFATESAMDASRSVAVDLHKSLGIQPNCLCLEFKQACFSGTGAINMAINHLKANFNNHPYQKVLVIMADIAYYGADTPGEATQGCGAIAMLISFNPKIAIFNNDGIILTEYHGDFCRPVHQKLPIYDGHLSIKCYLSMFEKALKQYRKNIANNHDNNQEFDYFVSHLPFARMLDKCCKFAGIDEKKNENIATKKYPSVVGNIYTASLYLGLLSLLENSNIDLSRKKIALFSYGSGSECELYSLTILPNYINNLHKQEHENMLKNRKIINFTSYRNLLQHYKNR